MNKKKSRVARRHFNKFEAEKLFKDKILEGEVVDTSRENPVLKPYRNAPNIIVEDLESSSVDEGDSFSVRVVKCMDGYMFGRSKNKDRVEDKRDESYKVSFSFAGHTFKGEFDSENTAEDVKNLLNKLYDFKNLELERMR